MSKIQKALENLRESRQTDFEYGGERGVNGEGRALVGGNGAVAARRRLDRSRLDRSRFDDVAAEILPETSIHIDLSLLREAGLYPSPENLEEISQEFRRIKRPVINLAFGEGQIQGDNANLIMMASALPKSGKTYCSLNLAASIARERDIGAVVVDADVLKPNISRALGLEDRIGLIDYLLDPEVELDDIMLASDWHNILFIPSGQLHAEATELLASRRMEQLVSSLAQRFRRRVVIVDTPPLLLTNEAHVLAEHMGQIVLVVEADVSTQESVLQALESLNRDKPINAILNKARGGFLKSHGYEGYGYYAMQGTEPTDEQKEER